MLTFAVQKKFRKKNISSSSWVSKVFGGFFRRIPLSYFWIVFAVVVVVWGAVLAFKMVFFTQENTIQRIVYDSWSVLQYDDPYLYKEIRTILKGENYYLAKWWEDTLLDILREKYPFVKSVSLELSKASEIHVRLEFYAPQLIFKTQQQRFAVYQDTIFPLYSGNRIWSGIFVVDLPEYTTGLSLTWNLKGIFFARSLDVLTQDFALLQQAFPTLEKLVYLVGGQRSIIYLPQWKMIYVNHLNDIALQIRKYTYLKAYYRDIGLFKAIDLWSLEKDKIIVTK